MGAGEGKEHCSQVEQQGERHDASKAPGSVWLQPECTEETEHRGKEPAVTLDPFLYSDPLH